MPQAQRKPRGMAPMPASFTDDPTEALTPEEEAALAAESAGEAPEPAETPAPAEPASTPAEPAAPPAEQPPAEPEVAAAPTKEPTPAQKRIQGLIDANKQLRQQLQTENEKWARMDERAKQMRELQDQAARQAQAAQQAAQRPDPDIDPQGARLWDLQQESAQLRQQLSDFQNQFQQFGQQNAQQQAAIARENYLNTDYLRVRNQRPDLDNAIEHLHQVRVRLNQALGYAPEQAEQLWNMERLAYVEQARQNGVSVNDFAYQMAQAVGYAPAAANGNGAARQAAAPQVLPAPQERVAQLQRAQQVQGLGGKIAAAESDQYANVRTMPAQQFAEFIGNMPEDDFLALANENPTLWKIISDRMVELG